MITNITPNPETLGSGAEYDSLTLGLVPTGSTQIRWFFGPEDVYHPDGSVIDPGWMERVLGDYNP